MCVYGGDLLSSQKNAASCFCGMVHNLYLQSQTISNQNSGLEYYTRRKILGFYHILWTKMTHLDIFTKIDFSSQFWFLFKNFS